MNTQAILAPAREPDSRVDSVVHLAARAMSLIVAELRLALKLVGAPDVVGIGPELVG